MSTTVSVRNGNIENAIREFSKKTSDTRSKVRERNDGYISPKKKRKKEAAEAKKQNRKSDRKDR